MAKIKLRRLLGLAGVAITESKTTQKLAMVFDWYMLGIAFWLPIQWYLEVGSILSDKMLFSLAWLIWGSFVLEAIVLGVMVKRKTYYFTGNWLNLVIIIVAFPLFYKHAIGFGVLRMVRLLVLLRIIVPWMHSAHKMLTLNRIGLSVLVLFAATSLSGVLVSTFDSGISNPFLGIWWAWETVTTVGYGDVVPTTPAGKIVAMVIMLLGIVLFSVVTATISAYFVGKDKKTQLYGLLEEYKEHLQKIEKNMKLLQEKIDYKNAEQLTQFVKKLTAEERRLLLQALEKLQHDEVSEKTKLF